MKNRYQIIMAYDNQTCIVESANDIFIIFDTLSWYLKDQHIVIVNVYDRLEHRNIVSWTR